MFIIKFCVLLACFISSCAMPSRFKSFGDFVSECSVGDACVAALEDPASNITATSVDNNIFCCLDGNAITVSVRRRVSGFNLTLHSTQYSTDEYAGQAVGLYGSGVYNGDNENQETASEGNIRELYCECREVDDTEVEEVFTRAGRWFWKGVEKTWNRFTNMF